MGELDFIRAFDTAAHAAFDAMGMGSVSGTYTPPGGAPLAGPVRAYVNREAGAIGSLQQIYVDKPTIGYLLADVSPVVGGAFASGADTWFNVEHIDNDGSLSWWAVRRG